MITRSFLGAASLLLFASCQPGAAAPPERSIQTFRAATYNIEWLTESLPTVRRDKLREIISEIDPSVLAIQEAESAKAVRAILPGEWSVAMLDSRGEDQEVAVAVKAPYKILRQGMLFTERRHDQAFPNDRDLLRVEVQTPGGETIVVFAVHLKSRRGGRMETDIRRVQAARLIAQAVSEERSPHMLVMGDFNDTPNDQSVNLLEKEASLVNLMDPLYDQDYVSVDLERWRGSGLLSQPRIRGAKDENERFRGRTYNYERDVKIKPVLFDQILVSQEMKKALKGSAAIYWARGILEGSSPNPSAGSGDQGTRASDHLPAYADFLLP